MAKAAQYIKSIEINSLWNGRKHIVWNLNPGVNVLSGVNGVGKSTILNKMINALRQKAKPGEYENGDFPGVTMKFEPEDAVMAHFDIVRSFDSTLLTGSVVDKIAADAAPLDDNGTMAPEDQPVIESVKIID